ncbi:FxsA family protein, partial [Micromonospora sp. KC721]|uniref:FxsA family protein n=1 Tax=Micromonospora sp. KC721 TaxID=2530380 RepID=UPI0010D8331F
LVGLAGALLLATPGLVSGVVGAVLLVPPVRGLTRAGVRRAAERRVSSTVAGDLFGPRTVRVRRADPQPPTGPVVDGGRALDGEVVEGEIVEPRQS